MKIRFAHATGAPCGQFVVSAETPEEHAILELFCDWPQHAKGEWVFRIHGHGRTNTDPPGTHSFNFGWAKP